MKVYVILYHEFGKDSELGGVYSEREKAVEELKENGVLGDDMASLFEEEVK